MSLRKTKIIAENRTGEYQNYIEVFIPESVYLKLANAENDDVNGESTKKVLLDLLDESEYSLKSPYARQYFTARQCKRINELLRIAYNKWCHYEIKVQ